ncbi:hypothetical protein ACED44_09555 [Vibrio splendidus]|uniref:hypothetical protein n=1 Tax=Vibrio splendidus TaxID=29497 RepID=UPI00352D6FDF
MQRKARVLNTLEDVTACGITREQVMTWAMLVIQHDDAQYPDDYNHQLQEGEEGFIPPIWRSESIIEPQALSRFELSV